MTRTSLSIYNAGALAIYIMIEPFINTNARMLFCSIHILLTIYILVQLSSKRNEERQQSEGMLLELFKKAVETHAKNIIQLMALEELQEEEVPLEDKVDTLISITKAQIEQSNRFIKEDKPNQED